MSGEDPNLQGGAPTPAEAPANPAAEAPAPADEPSAPIPHEGAAPAEAPIESQPGTTSSPADEGDRGEARTAAPVDAPPAVPLALPDFGHGPEPGASPRGIELLHDVELNVKIELGRAEMLIEEVLRLGSGSIVELDKLAGDPVDVLVNDRLVARGEVLVLNENFCVRISEIVDGRPDAEAA